MDESNAEFPQCSFAEIGVESFNFLLFFAFSCKHADL